MRKWIIAAVALVLIAAAVLVAVLNLNRYLNENRDWLAQQAESAIGRTVQFDEIGVSLWNGLGARVTNLRISEDPAYGKSDFLRVDRAYVLVKILPALLGRYEIRRVELDAPDIRIIRTARGFNFDSMGGRAGTGSERKESAGGGGAAATLPVVVALLRTNDGRVTFIDRTTQPASEIQLAQLDFAADDISLEEPISIDLAVAALGAAEQNIELSGTVGPVDLQNAPSTPFDLDLAVGPFVINELKKQPALAAVIPAELSSDDPITVKAKANGNLASLTIRTSFDLTGAAIAYGSSFRKPGGLRFQTDVNATRSDSTLKIEELDLRIADAKLRGKGTLTMGTPMRLDLSIGGDGVPLDGWGRLVPAASAYETSGKIDVDLAAKGRIGGGTLPQMTGTVVLHDVAAKQPDGPIRIEGLTSRITLRGNQAEMPPAEFRLGKSPVTVQAKLDEVERPRGTFRLQSPSLYPVSVGAAESEAEVLRDLEVQGSFRLAAGGVEADADMRSASGQVRGISYSDLTATAHYRPPRIDLPTLSLRAFDGTYSGRGFYDMSNPEKPEFSFDSKINGMEVAPLVGTYFPGFAEQVGGRVDTNLDLTGAGTTWAVIRETLKGDGAFELKDGALKNFNLAEGVLTQLTGVSGLTQLLSANLRQKYPKIFAAKNTTFDVLRGAVEIAQGGAVTKNVRLDAKDFAVTGKGIVTFSNTVDFDGSFVASDPLSQDLVQSVDVVKYLTNSGGRLEVPFTLKGDLPNVKPRPNEQFVAQALQRAVVGKGLDALFGRKEEKQEAEATPAAEKKPRPEDALRKGLEQLLGK